MRADAMKDWLTIIGWLAIFAGIVTLGHSARGESFRAAFGSLWALSKAYLRGGIIMICAAMIFWLVVGALELLGLL